MKIGVLGLEFGSGNKGCEALAFSFLHILNQIAIERNECFDIVICMNCNIERIKRKMECENLSLESRFMGKIMHIKHKKSIFRECDIVYDFTAGDSFADIYGMKRFLRGTMNKQSVLWAKKPLILGSQTYGPFKSKSAKIWAGHIIKKSFATYARDEMSMQLAKSISGRNDISQTVDVAFVLPYDRNQYSLSTNGKVKIGINPSGLLWAGGYNRKNQFAMVLDYKKYCIDLISKLVEENKYEIHLISHVLYKDLSLEDNDIVACKVLKDMFPQVIEAPVFDSPMEAKSYISNMDIFIGARMHATIAAFTSGVATIPISYSRKFEGLYGTLNYPYVISGTKVGTDEALKSTYKYVKEYELLRKEVKEKTKDIETGKCKLYNTIKDDLASVLKK